MNLLANLVADGRLDIKIALVENNKNYGIYHEKIELIFGKKDKTRKKLSTIKNIRIIAKQIDMLAYMNITKRTRTIINR